MNRYLYRYLLLLLIAGACARAESAQLQQQASPDPEVEVLLRKLAEKETDARLQKEYIDKVTIRLNDTQKRLQELTGEHNALRREYSELKATKGHAPVSQSDDLIARIQSISKLLEASKREMDAARREAAESDLRNDNLVQLVETLQADLEAKTLEVAVLHVEIEKLRVELVRRDQENEILHGQVVDIRARLSQAERDRAAQQQEIDRVYYRTGSYEALQRDNVIRAGFLDWSLATTNFGKETLQKYNRYLLREIRFNVPKWRLKIITRHGRGSYRWESLANGTTILHIKKVKDFWSTDDYLIIAADVTSPDRRRPGQWLERRDP